MGAISVSESEGQKVGETRRSLSPRSKKWGEGHVTGADPEILEGGGGVRTFESHC